MMDLPLVDGLLEQWVLRLGRPDSARLQPLETLQGRLVGGVRWRSGWAGGRPLLPGLCLAVHESGDEPLLFTVHRAWEWRAWYEVRDADDRPMGRLRGACVWDRYGNVLAEARQGVFVGSGGLILADWLPAEGELHFRQEIDPPGRMLLLARVLLFQT